MSDPIGMPSGTILDLDQAALRAAVEHWLNDRVLKARVSVLSIQVESKYPTSGVPFTEPERARIHVCPEGSIVLDRGPE